jgi:hypothetical protein
MNGKNKESKFERLRREMATELRSARKLLKLFKGFMVLPARKTSAIEFPAEVKYLGCSNGFELYIGGKRYGGK